MEEDEYLLGIVWGIKCLVLAYILLIAVKGFSKKAGEELQFVKKMNIIEVKKGKMHKPESVIKNNKCNMLCDFPIQRDVSERRQSDKRKECRIINFAVSGYQIVKM